MDTSLVPSDLPSTATCPPDCMRGRGGTATENTASLARPRWCCQPPIGTLHRSAARAHGRIVRMGASLSGGSHDRVALHLPPASFAAETMARACSGGEISRRQCAQGRRPPSRGAVRLAALGPWAPWHCPPDYTLGPGPTVRIPLAGPRPARPTCRGSDYVAAANLFPLGKTLCRLAAAGVKAARRVSALGLDPKAAGHGSGYTPEPAIPSSDLSVSTS